MNPAARRGPAGPALRLLLGTMSLLWLLSGAATGSHHHHALGVAEPIASDTCAACTLAHAPALGATAAAAPAPGRTVVGGPDVRPPIAPAPAPSALPDSRGPPAA